MVNMQERGKQEGTEARSSKMAGRAKAVTAEGHRLRAYRRECRPRLEERFRAEVVSQLIEAGGYRNIGEVPRVVKVTVNMGLGEAVANPKVVESALDELTAITGQRAVVTKARKSIAAFKLRQGMKIGVTVTLRRERMYEFLERLICLALPRVRDFKGVSGRSFDGRGNFTLGIREQIIFPEIEYDKIDKVKGLSVVIVTSAKTDDEARSLLKALGMPFRS